MRRLLLLLTASPAVMAFRVNIPRPALCERAELVVVAEVTGAETRWAAGPEGGIETLSDLAVIEVVKGRPPQDLRVLSPGGALGGLRYSVEDAAALRVDHRYLLLLDPVDGGFRVVGGVDGAIPLRWGDSGPGEDRVEAIATLGSCRAP
ncbi:MAG: hypothetical protein H6741_08385 [Alphaproteobacteria bacterium]|nr:hypothetical protein [Alphaproteobacteria bacterium]MCB9792734.1 hypothetical protein [Alphaproteobacteria bacterium]